MLRVKEEKEIREWMSEHLKGIVPPPEIEIKARLVEKILKLKEEKNAVILGHNYMEPALFHTIPDYKGDSLELCRRAQEADKDIIVFCGVRFMAETAKILNPTKKVLIPSLKAGCSLAESITAEEVRSLREMYPGIPIVAYINTYAEVKAEVDVCCTSSNAVKIVESLDSPTIIFLPDEYLARNVARETGRKVLFPTKTPPKNTPTENFEYVMIAWKGRCEVHEQFTVEDIENVRKQFPDVVVLAHPECSEEVVKACDFSGSTTAMIRYVRESSAHRFLLLTECSMADNILAENPDKEMVRLCSVRCQHMAQITLEDTLESLTKEQFEIEIPDEIRVRALKSIERMLELSQ